MTIYDFHVKGQDGSEVALEKYKGKVLLVVNTAIKCGLTPQYDALEALYKKYKDRGFEILDFPSNQFLEQAPGTAEEINSFCTMNFNTTFDRFAKINVNGEDTIPLYRWLKTEAPDAYTDSVAKEFLNKVKDLVPRDDEHDIKWNFEKFLIDREGRVAERFSPAITPDKLESKIEELL